ncbi:MAG: hypothetical protein A3G34_01485 [Candidatus Lindowbacteria bacterium RIFCSPLOWO2_12_FULL_62_27]|nr:MAG: hypothetical protein A3G34_01485 [Candidatus Lindowbacteria bacterium RIFCSPLOWO2_12_FULL_62_27]OGH61930.1 MAG: hypothetical protein A3I06_03500 [Candidatus Lindowbacteria bacterium RIFCSPLOWO2_02_FULL_62_12]
MEDLLDFHSVLDRVFNDGGTARPVAAVGLSPAVDIIEEKDRLLIKADLPGLKKDDIKITVEDDVMILEAQKKEEKQTDGTDYHLIERSSGTYRRSFRLPNTVDMAKVDAQFQDGVLTLVLPKRADAKPKTLDVKIR